MGGGGPGGGGSNDDNPFQQETNQKRLQDLLGRLKGSNAEAAAAPAP
jgi:hypothetical protein